MSALNDIFIKLLNMSITASYVIIIIMAVRFFFRKLPKKYSYFLWIIAGLRLIFPFSLTSAFSFFNLNNFAKVNSGTNLQEYIPLDIGFADTPTIDTGVSVLNKTVNYFLPPAQNTNSINPLQIVLFFAVIIWLIGITLIIGYEIFLYFRTKKLVKKAVLYKDNIYECDNIPTPFVTGIVSPKIYIPFRLKEPELSLILHHENYHIKRRDNIIKAISSLIVTIYWFNPIIWAAYFYMNRDMEMSCDEEVISKMGNEAIKNYGSSLLSFAINKRCLPLGPLAFGESYVSKRVKNILKFKKPKMWISVFCVFIVIIIGIVCLTNGNKTIGDINNFDILNDIPIETASNDKTNFMIAGIDNANSLADTIIVGSYNGNTGELNLLSIPRDTAVTFTDSQKQLINNTGNTPPESTKMGSIPAYAGDKYGIKILEEQSEEILKINIDYYFEIDLNGFKNIVDSVGGIYFDIPKEGMNYSDPLQNLYINLIGGRQLLSGSSAESLVRFRKGYPRQDLQRTEVSREFIKEFITQTLEKKDLKSLAADCLKLVKNTNFKASDIIRYIKQIEKFDTANFSSHTLPGDYQSIDRTLCYIYDKEETAKLVKEIF